MSQRKKLLHVGCSEKRENSVPPQFSGPDWDEIRLDIDPAVKPDYVADICDMASVADGSMDALWSSHNIEHLYPHDVPRALKEFYRVLNEGGQLHIALPDMQRVAQFVAVGILNEPVYISPMGPIAPIDIMYGHRPSMAIGNLFMAHKSAFTAQSLATSLLDAGFSNVLVIRYQFDLYATAQKLAIPSQPRDRYQWQDRGGPTPTERAA